MLSGRLNTMMFGFLYYLLWISWMFSSIIASACLEASSIVCFAVCFAVWSLVPSISFRMIPVFYPSYFVAHSVGRHGTSLVLLTYSNYGWGVRLCRMLTDATWLSLRCPTRVGDLQQESLRPITLYVSPSIYHSIDQSTLFHSIYPSIFPHPYINPSIYHCIYIAIYIIIHISLHLDLNIISLLISLNILSLYLSIYILYHYLSNTQLIITHHSQSLSQYIPIRHT